MFFSEENNQKILISRGLSCSRPTPIFPLRKNVKVFWFSSSEKNILTEP
jgi:hypothetical protein